ncbi:MAG TPA: hypothetical protein VG964_01985 [Candidatus Saccharimonadales bacterium]|nr:hypothetical protein [Candidatus Saccharimonadales bacterium]
MKKWLRSAVYTLIVAGVFAGCGYVLASHKDKAEINHLRSQIADLQKTTSKTATQSSIPSKQTSYAEIVTFKVKFPYANKPAGLGYTDTATDTVAFDSETLSDYANKLDPKNTCGLEAAPGPLGFLKRTTNLPLTDANSDRDGLVKQVGSYYYLYLHPKNCSTNQSVINEQKTEVSDLIADLRNLQ